MSQAVLFDGELPGERFPGQLSVEATRLRFEDGRGHDRELGCHRLVCRTGGIDSRTVYFTHPDHPGVEIVCNDFALLQVPPLSELPAVQAAVASSLGYNRRYWGGLAMYGCLALAALVLGGGLIFGLLRFVLGVV